MHKNAREENKRKNAREKFQTCLKMPANKSISFPLKTTTLECQSGLRTKHKQKSTMNEKKNEKLDKKFWQKHYQIRQFIISRINF